MIAITPQLAGTFRSYQPRNDQSRFAGSAPVREDYRSTIRPLHQSDHKPLGRGNVIRFSGQAMAQSGKNVLWVMVENPIERVSSGLSNVAKAMLPTLNLYLGKDARLIAPYFESNAKEDEQKRAEGKATLTFKSPEGKEITYSTVFEDTGAEVQLPIFEQGKGTKETFSLLQKFIPIRDEKGQPVPNKENPAEPLGNWVYAIDNEKYFRHFEKAHVYKETPMGHEMEGIDSDPARAMTKQVLMFTRAAAAFIPMLSGNLPVASGRSNLRTFKGDIDVLMAHDYHAGLLWSELPENDKSAHVFMVHNHYDGPLDWHLADALDLKVPDYMAKKNPGTSEIMTSQGFHSLKARPVPAQGALSPAQVGIQSADVVIANHNYVRTLTETNIVNGTPFVTPLKEKFQNGQVADMHHALLNSESPYTTSLLKQEEGFQHLKELTPEALKDFKRANKLALQKKIGLKEDENAVVFFSIPRVDPFQKGSNLILEEMEKFLKAPGHEKAQMILVMTHGKSPLATNWVEKLQSDPELKGRLFLLYDQSIGRDLCIPMWAGSDYFLIPSVYEPYGQTQLEAMSMGGTVIGHGRDGIRSTVSDPEMREKGFLPQEPAEKVWEYGQTGILMRPFDPEEYREALAFKEKILTAQDKLKTGQWAELNGDEMKALLVYMFNGNRWPESYEKTLTHAQESYREAIDRAYDMATQEPEKLIQLQLNSLKYCQKEHSPETIAKRYVQAIDMAVAERNKRLAGSRLAAFA